MAGWAFVVQRARIALSTSGPWASACWSMFRCHIFRCHTIGSVTVYENLPRQPAHSLLAVVAVDLTSGNVTRVTPANGASWSLLAAQDGECRLAGAHSSAG